MIRWVTWIVVGSLGCVAEQTSALERDVSGEVLGADGGAGPDTPADPAAAGGEGGAHRDSATSDGAEPDADGAAIAPDAADATGGDIGEAFDGAEPDSADAETAGDVAPAPDAARVCGEVVGQWRQLGECPVPFEPDVTEDLWGPAGRAPPPHRVDHYSELSVEADGRFELGCFRDDWFQGPVWIRPVDGVTCDDVGRLLPWASQVADCWESASTCMCTILRRQALAIAGTWRVGQGAVTLTHDAGEVSLTCDGGLRTAPGTFHPAACFDPVPVPLALPRGSLEPQHREVDFGRTPRGFAVAWIEDSRAWLAELDEQGSLVGDPVPLSADGSVAVEVRLVGGRAAWVERTAGGARLLVGDGEQAEVLGVGDVGDAPLGVVATADGFEVLWSTDSETLLHFTLDTEGRVRGPSIRRAGRLGRPTELAAGGGHLAVSDGWMPRILAEDDPGLQDVRRVDGTIVWNPAQMEFAALEYPLISRHPPLYFVALPVDGRPATRHELVMDTGAFSGGLSLHVEGDAYRTFWGDSRDLTSPSGIAPPREIYTQLLDFAGEPVAAPQRVSLTPLAESVRPLVARTDDGYAMLRSVRAFGEPRWEFVRLSAACFGDP